MDSDKGQLLAKLKGCESCTETKLLAQQHLHRMIMSEAEKKRFQSKEIVGPGRMLFLDTLRIGALPENPRTQTETLPNFRRYIRENSLVRRLVEARTILGFEFRARIFAG
jgi:hypothetical protein